VRSVKSIPDYVVRKMGAWFLEEDSHAALGINTQPTAPTDTPEARSEAEVQPAVRVSAKVHPPRPPARVTTAGTGACSKCGSLMQQTGKCMTCTGCGDTGGCG
jgi:hypothetical protein